MAVLLTEFNDHYARDIAAELIKKGLHIEYLVTSDISLYTDRKNFPSTTFIDEKKFHFIDKVSQLNQKNSRSLSQKFIKDHFELESLFLSISDRITFDPKTVRLRKQVYYDLLLYWSTFLKEKEISTIIFARVPHLGYGNIIYYLAKELGLKIVIVRETLLENKILLTEGYNDNTQVPQNYLANLTLIELRQKLGKVTLEAVFKPSSLMQLNFTDNKTSLKQNSAFALTSIFNWSTFKALASLIHNPFERVYFSPTFLEPPTTWLGFYWMMARHYLKNAQLYAFYQKHSHKVDLKKKYVYLALHYQPERTTMPEGGVFENQLLMIDILSKSLPKGWLLYVKEHPYQFTRSDMRKMNFRDQEFYLRIKKYSNVRLVALTINSAELIKNCQCSVTLTGSTGWETLQAKKPVILFSASAWYSACRSCYLVHSQEECTQAFSAIKNETPANVEKNVLRYLLYYHKQYVEAAYDYYLSDLSQIPSATLVNNLANAIIKRV